jgi:hypothetical protein
MMTLADVNFVPAMIWGLPVLLVGSVIAIPSAIALIRLCRKSKSPRDTDRSTCFALLIPSTILGLIVAAYGCLIVGGGLISWTR